MFLSNNFYVQFYLFPTVFYMCVIIIVILKVQADHWKFQKKTTIPQMIDF